MIDNSAKEEPDSVDIELAEKPDKQKKKLIEEMD
jgi:hypothetical protein